MQSIAKSEQRGPRPARRRRSSGGLVVATLVLPLAAAIAAVLVLGSDGPLGHLTIRAPDGKHASPATAGGQQSLAHYLVRSTLSTLDDANRTGNYTVLRGLASPGFQSANSADRLAEIFAIQRQQQLDLSLAALASPEWTEAPTVGTDRRLHLAGAFAGTASRLAFRLAFEASGGEWRLDAIHVAVEPLSKLERVAADRH